MKLNILSIMSPAKAKEKRAKEVAKSKSRKRAKMKAALECFDEISNDKSFNENLNLYAAGHKIFGDALIKPSEILANSEIFKKICGVYFLIKQDQVIYVGQSIDILSRLSSHSNYVIFDSYSFIICQKNELDFLESFYIHMLQPLLNADHITNGKIAPLSAESLINLADGL